MQTLRNGYFSEGIANSTNKTYQVAWKSYVNFCTQVGIPILPVSEYHLQLYVSAVAQRLSYKTIKVYLCGIRFYSLKVGYNVNLRGMECLEVVMRGIRRQQGKGWTRPQRDPIEVRHLATLSRMLAGKVIAHDHDMIMAALTLAFFGLLRSAEYTSETENRYDIDTTLTREDVSFNALHNCMRVYIKVSKTDPFRQGAIITYRKVDSVLCPVSAMLKYLTKNEDIGPLFKFQSGKYLTRAHVYKLFGHFMNINLNTHSLRIGGATLLSKAGVPEHVIQKIGRWSSGCFKKYVRLTSEHVQSAYNAISQYIMPYER